MTATEATLDAVFAALADRTRRAMLSRLMHGEATVSELAEPFDMTQPAISKHIKVLQSAGLVSRSREGRSRPCRLQARRLKQATEWMERYRRFWEVGFDRLDELLAEMKNKEATRGRKK